MLTPMDKLKKNLWWFIRKYDLEMSQEQVSELADILFIYVDDMIEKHLENFDHEVIDRDY